MSVRRRTSRGPSGAITLAIVGFLALAGVSWWWYGGRTSDDPVRPTPTTVDQAAEVAAPEAAPIDLPELDASDAFVAELVSALSAHPTLASWLVTDDLVDRFVGVVVDLAGGLSPSSSVEFLIPEQEFRVRQSGESLVLDPASYPRYDLLTEVFVSLDTRGTARLYHQLHPLFEEAYSELGIPNQTFDDAMRLAVENLLAVEVPQGPIELLPNESVYEFSDLRLEALSPAEKHLIRMGPDRARRIQTKLAELWSAIESGGGSTAR